METIGLIAGNGTFPVSFAREAKARGVKVAAVAHRGETVEGLESEVDSIVWVKVGQLGKMIAAFKKAGVQRAVMAGGINKVRSLGSIRPDFQGIRFLARAVSRGDDALLRGLAGEFEAAGISIVPSTLFLERMLSRRGIMAGPPLTKDARADIATGCGVLRALGALDVGQSVVVEHGVVLAIEAIEGTDAALRRAGELGRGKAVMIKMSKEGQDMRFDVPAVGSATIAVMRESGVTTAALEAGATLLLDDEDFLAKANAAGITVVGIDRDGSCDEV